MNELSSFAIRVERLTLSAPIPQTGQTHSNYSLAVVNELFECV